ncbi:MAG: enoyl-CoA hydratase-related protein [Syntrophorhabdales bacterium]|jgi:enoyl-CoA hydratase/carnithine racemase
MEKSTYIRWEEEGGIGTVTIDNPPANSLGKAVLTELASVLDDVSSTSIKALIITGGKGKIFVSGANIKELVDMDKDEGTRTVSYVQEVFSKVRLFPRPVFCAINGHALGGGLELALHCDFRVAVEGVKFGQPEISLGVLPGAGGTQLLPRLIGLAKARWLLLSGQTLSAQEALACGLVDRVVKAESLLESTREMARQIAEKPPLAVQAIRKMLRLVQSPALAEGMEGETEMFGELCATEDKREGVVAFLENRKAEFQGK